MSHALNVALNVYRFYDLNYLRKKNLSEFKAKNLFTDITFKFLCFQATIAFQFDIITKLDCCMYACYRLYVCKRSFVFYRKANTTNAKTIS